jgi:toxin-antitoxin system PIN domain toxin
MTSHLLDVNVLVALIDPTHEHHERAHAWFADEGDIDWITVPITENGVLRIVSHPAYSNSQPTPVVLISLASLCALPGHRFEPDALSILDGGVEPLLSSAQVTDSYLVALAAYHGAKLATLDQKMAVAPRSTSWVTRLP